MTIPKFRFKNKIIFSGFILLFSLLLISWIFASNFFEIMTMDYNAPDLVQGNHWDMRMEFLKVILTWENLVDSSMYHLINFMPIFAVIPTLVFFDEKNYLFSFSKNKLKSIKSYLCSSILFYSLLCGFFTSIVFTLFYSLGGVFVYRSLENIGGFLAIFSKDFYVNHPYLVFLIMIWTVFFSASFVLGFLLCTLMILFNKRYQAIIALLTITFSFSVIDSILGLNFLNIYQMFLAFNTIKQTLFIFLPVVPFFILALVFYLIGCKKVEEGLA
ncbi:MAG: hypothetical protein LBV67_06430 [Streptococcaceae bacterium]|jgi:hypothetical protein|nr:hypothetical protein [Streptococcaceae bacterium]